eukprot:TRINITY_DN47390_c0_g1_i1.p1 TRINITY_DN47390_c0_g1~~TRINITY_DN47390_c0_g1_i1.p1  ORF type:complete len:554 (+),score=76.93 TRINITY_DN47390_c0_g1_i1:171-1832(+)
MLKQPRRLSKSDEDRQEEGLQETALGEGTPLLPPSDGSWSINDFSETLGNALGAKFLTILLIAQVLVKGFIATMEQTARPYMFRAFNTPAPQLSIYQGIVNIPWAMKPFFGVLSDSLPVRGYNRSPYILDATVLGVSALLFVGFGPESALTVDKTVLCLIAVQAMIAITDLFTEARYAEVIQEKCPNHATTIVSFVWGCVTVGGLVAVIGVGLAIARFGVRGCYAILILPAMVILPPLAHNFLEEKVATPERTAAVRARLKAQPQILAMCVLFFACSILLTVIGICFEEPYINCIASISVGLLLLICLSLVFHPLIAKFACFCLIQASLSWDVSSAAFYFYTDTAAEYPDGPHFSVFFYTSVLGAVSYIFSLCGIVVYQKYFTGGTYRGIIVKTNCVMAVLHFLDCLMFARENKRLGIDDHRWILGAAVLGNLVQQWTWMPLVVAISYVCPKNMEATLYALMAACMNIGTPIASSCSALLLEKLGCTPTGGPGDESAKFESLWKASALCSAISLAATIVSYNLLPDARQNERLIEDPHFEATTDSVLNTYMGW